MNSSKCCFCNADLLNKTRWSVVVRELNTMDVYAQAPDRKQLRNVCNECMVEINKVIDKLGGLDSTTPLKSTETPLQGTIEPDMSQDTI